LPWSPASYPAGVRHLDRDAAALQVEERQRVVFHSVIDAGADSERRALVIAHAQPISIAGGGHRREVDLVHQLACGGIIAE
jgi:hypothetical protein